MTTRVLGRRAFLRGFAGAAVALPLLEACDAKSKAAVPGAPGSTSFAYGSGGARNFVGMMVPNGVHPVDWFPPGTALTLGASLAPLERHRENLVLFKNVDNVAAERTPSRPGHVEGVASMLSGVSPLGMVAGRTSWVGGGITIDQEIANAIETSGLLTPKKSLELGPFDSDGYGAIAYSGRERPLPGYSDPRALFSVLFPNLDPDSFTKLAARRGRQRSILDGTASDLDRISKKVGKVDRDRIAEHLDAVRSVEKRIDAVTSCSPGTYLPPATFEDERALRKAFLDVVVLAMACDVTRVATFAWHRSGAIGPTFPWLGFPDDLHEITHQVVPESYGTLTTFKTKLTQILAFFSEQQAYFVDALKRTRTADGETLFDRTVILQGSDISWNHQVDNIPFLLLAGGKTGLKTGQVVAPPPKTPHNNLLVTLLHAFGIQATNFGDPTVCTGDLDTYLKA